MEHPWRRAVNYRPLRARSVFVAAGVLGTLRLLFYCRDVAKSLPDLSRQLGRVVRTNSEAIVGALGDPDANVSEGGPTITSHFYANPRTHITQNRFPPGYEFMKFYMGPLVDGSHPARRALGVLRRLIRHPLRHTRSWRTSQWHRRVTILTVMQQQENFLSFDYGRAPLSLFRRNLRSHPGVGQRAPTFLPEANAAARALAAAGGGEPLNVLFESIGNLSITAHILGGSPMGRTAAHGVIDTSHQVFNYPGLYVVDGSVIPANVGVNPSLTITALAERCLSQIPPVSYAITPQADLP